MKVLCIFGTRPEAIKLAPVIEALRAAGVAHSVCVTAQHRELLDQVLETFSIRPDHDLDLMTMDQGLSELTAAAIRGLAPIIRQEAPDWVVVQGDTTTAFAAALTAFHAGVRIAHVEAGLRTATLHRPFPEEANRRLVDVIADVLFAPTETARQNLLAVGVAPSRIHVTGNTVVDALQMTLDRSVSWSSPPLSAVPRDRRLVLVTTHRREHFGRTLAGVCSALAEIAAKASGVELVVSTHPNPAVRGTVEEHLRGVPHVTLLDPLPYAPFVHLLAAAELVLTDSGGLQEEGPALGRPVLVMREETERPEGVAAGVVRVIGTDPGVIAARTLELLCEPTMLADMARPTDVFGDGHAAERIVRILVERE